MQLWAFIRVLSALAPASVPLVLGTSTTGGTYGGKVGLVWVVRTIVQVFPLYVALGNLLRIKGTGGRVQSTTLTRAEGNYVILRRRLSSDANNRILPSLKGYNHCSLGVLMHLLGRIFEPQWRRKHEPVELPFVAV